MKLEIITSLIATIFLTSNIALSVAYAQGIGIGTNETIKPGEIYSPHNEDGDSLLAKE